VRSQGPPAKLAAGMGPLRHALRAVSGLARLRSAAGKSVDAIRTGGFRGLLDAVRERTGWLGAYEAWVARFDRPGSREVDVLRRRAASHPQLPLVSVLLTGSAAEADVRRSVGSLDAQVHRRWELCKAPRGIESPLFSADGAASSRIASAVAAARGDIIVPLEAGDELAPWALFTLAETLSRSPEAQAAYADFDHVDRLGRRFDPVFKPDWDPELVAWPDYLGRAAAFRKSVFATAEGNGQPLHAARRIPHVLCHVGSRASPVPPARVSPPAAWPRVSAIVPTRDGGAMLRRCLASLASPFTGYPDLEIIVVDNQSRGADTLDLLDEVSREGRARVIRFDRPFNYPAINNEASRAATGEVLVLLNDDVEATEASAGWLHELVSHALRPGVGPVGAKLLYPDGTIQHAGIVTGLFGMVGHLHRGARAERASWMADHPRTVSAVTAAVLAVRRDIYQQLDGLDERFAVAFNDVDFCLRAERAGHRTLYSPRAILLHHESRTRGRDDTPEKRARFERETALLRARFGDRLLDDPHYSPNLSLWSDRARLAWPPRVPRLWD